MSASAQVPVAEARGVSKRFQRKTDMIERFVGRLTGAAEPPTVHALDNVSLTVMKGEVVGLVGESGCGKSTLGRAIAGMLPVSDGVIAHEGRDIASLRGRARMAMRLGTQIIFQDPMSSLNPRKTVREIIGEAPRVHGLVAARDIDRLVSDLLARVGLDPAMANRYPHQFSGGQRQRIGIARALAVKPEFLICDESIAALDVSIQAQVINLFMDLKRDLGLTLLFISHDLSVVQHISDRVVVMYLGRVVESAPTDEIFGPEGPRHPYTAALLAEVPRIERREHSFSTVKGEIPSPLHPPSGCHFHPRCPFAMDICKTTRPELRDFAGGHAAACHLHDGQGLRDQNSTNQNSSLQGAK
ncbi:ABC transporter ATP-binding protein [Paracoccus aminophilus]|uniref:Peptide/nickel transport system, ATP-binding protein n=1 Tax=Paracoccus aminophilus JCM 7686 TaxID=1367847 RepID=S5YUC4_PARAH|nr:ABC transporter ATP-binding protein [Paracoccus aminophilus]AGT08846.1 peptide/nickel transport system, ATP-binding protein [Paracoccus aminophilus JCM 7686]